MTSNSYTENRDNYCYRHPKRQSFVLCQRCTRTVCVECQTQASVGVICPECMKEMRKKRTPAQKRAARTWGRRSGGATAAFGSASTRGTTAIFVVTAVTYLLQLLSNVVPGFQVQGWLMFYAPIAYIEPWRILTVALVHSGFWHVGMNMLALWMLGRSLEPLLGTWRFVTTYLLTTAAGSAAVALLAYATPVVGASGAIFGLFGALIVIGRHLGARMTGIYIVLGINLLLGFLPGFSIAWQAHVGGLVFGALIGLVFTRTRRPKQRTVQIVLLCGVGLVIVGLFLVPLSGIAFNLP